ncbi:histidine kinase N-terminal domain-containing protein [Clostridium felsineum]|uniref:histidine kinase n=1 Tax=Clostridium felsineum TaxID=36839 RepID=A0A1S8KYX9_9CLOT|nr:histidine kinase N-terminal domain-containing protein [Clostridium felsineum]URZ04013.1 putative sensor histidine kinase pdtaS [Clostridium felsineum]URZ07732.1 putative sensor histidine kinase pdtaS [Clostridium felsineum]URZ12763.1 putative sensor histidine kinase pdtaS [Clostridium felsineum]
MLRKLCELNTDLSEEDITELENIERSISMFATLFGGDIFIDCLTKDSDIAIVVSEARPLENKSLYKNSVVGEFALRKNEPAVLRTLEIGTPTTELKAVTQENIVVKQNTVPIKNKNEKVIGVLIMEKDVTEHIIQSQNMEILSETTKQLSETLMNIKDVENNTAYNLINDGILAIDDEGTCVYANYTAKELYKKIGYKDDIVGMSFDNLVLNKLKLKDILRERKSLILETRVGKFDLQIKYGLIKKDIKICGIIILIKDLTDIKKKEKELVLKAVAIREIHHRVKNNLQTIASILRLQARRIEDYHAKKAFYESINRILSIATTHEVLAQKGIDDADIKVILLKLKDNAIRNSLECNKNIIIKLQGDNIYVNSDKATAIAIVVNELIENSIKHAFYDKEEGIIEILINKGHGYASIAVSDNGSGFKGKKLREDSLGLNIVKSIVTDKLNGNIKIETNENGTKVAFDLKIHQ